MVALVFNAYPAYLALSGLLSVTQGQPYAPRGTGLGLLLLLLGEELWFLSVLRYFRRPKPPAS